MKTSRQSARKLLIRLSILFVITIATTATASAGTGKFEPDGNGGGKFNFCVSVRFNSTEAQLQLIRKAFEDGSQVLADATDSHHRFGTINIVNNDTSSAEDAEFWILPGTGRAVSTYGGFGKKGQHVQIYFLPDYTTPEFINDELFMPRIVRIP